MSAISRDELLGIGRSFWEARILLTAAELDLFTLLAHEAHSADEVANAHGGDLRATTILLDALAAMDLLAKHRGRYTCPPDVAAHLATHAPESILPMLQHQASLWPSWSELTGIVRGDAAAWDRAHAPRAPGATEAFIGAMHVVGAGRAPRVAAAIKPQDARRLLDVGGASGTYTLAMLAVNPALEATIFDQPDVVALARERCAAAGVSDRVTLVGGDFYTDELPGGHDLALLSAIIHQNSPPQNVALYEKVQRALVPGGRLVIRDHVLSPDRTSPRAGAVFAINMLVRTESGNTYTFEEIRETLAAAGFERIAQLNADDAGMNGLVEAYRPTT